LPVSICELPLQALVVNNNKLVSLPEEIGKMQTLMELDASCNEITHLPVQIGDLAGLKVLNLRRNHLQEIPIEISYLQLTTLDLSGNRIATLPVELRFMTTVMCLNLGENPLTCPPANLVSRGRIHVFKYLEIQAIKEDRKRGVLQDNGDYRRSYRKTAQLNDFRFASGFGADARRKRHTADSGYGSEQPLDRRWSQEFNQEGGSDNQQHQNNADDTRRIIMRAANCQRSPRSAPPPLPEVQQQPPKPTRNNNPTPLTSTGSTTSSSSGYSSINASEQMDSTTATTAVNASSNNTISNASRDHVDYACHPNPSNPNNNNSVIPVPTLSSSSNESSSGNCRIIPIIKEKPTTLPQPNQSKPGPQQNGQHVHHETTRNEESPDDYEKEERRRAAHKVLGKQAQFKEQLRNDAATANEAAERGGYHQQPRLTASALARMQQLQQGSSGAENTTALPSSTTRSLYDVKAMQKEAVLSYVKSKQGPSPARSVAGRGSQPDLQSNAKNSSNLMSNGTRAASTTSIPQRSPTGIIQKQALKNGHGLIRGHHSSNLIVANTRRAEVEKSASADAHINQLRMEIESRLRISLPEDISASLADGVILCHVANHVRPRAVPSIHVPSPSVPKLNTAKCRRNVENFLLACRKIGVREDLICSPSDILEPRKQGSVRVAISVSELLRFHHLRTT